MFNPKPGDQWVVGGKQYTVCGKCLRVVRLNKPLLGPLHLCES